ncbi:MAG: peptidylprolyl isomerase [Methyloversatilis sp.]|jgi:peptidyl-prolyl cis-trans isomerase C|nr:peptidylprolyl isomerase [Methyloversatilis sp.]MBP6192924.1 peptidylprolyl isomerase [Methyloversatilis sp.]MBP9117055.1 peptidylprolyl isomerase [Methyloversatilis sp.]
MKYTLSILSLAVLTAFPVASMAQQKAKEKPAAASSDSVLATVNGKTIPAGRAEIMVRNQIAQGQQDGDQLRQAVREELIRREVLTQAAATKGLDKNAALMHQADLARQAVLIQAYLQDYVKSHPVTEAAIKSEYEKVKAGLGDKEYKARHILVKTEDKAKEIIGKLQVGEKFEDLAKDSEDPGSKDRGGDLGWSAPSQYVKSFSEALTKLEKGKFTPQPIRTDFGYHVIKLEDVRDLKLPGFDEAKQQIAQRLEQQVIAAHVNELRQKAVVK